MNANGTLTFTFPNTNPYDGNDDNFVGVINNYSGAVTSLTLSGNTDIFGFDGDGIDVYGIAGNTTDTTAYGSGAYGGSDAYFTSISAGQNLGTVNFIGGIAGGGSGYFSLEEAPSAGLNLGGTVTISQTPEPNTLLLLGTGAVGLFGIVRRKLAA